MNALPRHEICDCYGAGCDACGSCFHCGAPVRLDDCEFLPAEPGHEPEPCCLECWDAGYTMPPHADQCPMHGVWEWEGNPCRRCDAMDRHREMLKDR